jgi:hypothetical protein
VVGFQLAVWFTVFSRLQAIRRHVRSTFSTSSFWSAILALVMIAAMVRLILYFYPSIDSPLNYQFARSVTLQTGTVVAIGPAVLSAWRIRAWLDGVKDHVAYATERGVAGHLVSAVVDADHTLQHLMFMCSAVVVAAVFQVGAFRNAFLAHHPDPQKFPVVVVIQYGLLFTIVLAFIFFPIVARLNDLKEQVLNLLYPLPPDGRPGEDWYVARGRMEHMMRLPKSSMEKLRSGYAVFGPLVGSVISVFLPGVTV